MQSIVRVTAVLMFFWGMQLWHCVPVCQCEAEQSRYTLQVMSGSNRDAAFDFTVKLQDSALDARMYEVTYESGNRYYKVVIGSFDTRKEALEYARRLEDAEIDYWVTPLEMVSSGNQAARLPLDNQTSRSGDLPQNRFPEPDDESADSDNRSAPPPTEEALTESGDLTPAGNRTGAQSSRPGAGGETAAAEWPDGVSRIYKYYDGSRVLHVTNELEKVPEKFRVAIRQIIIFPVRFVSFDAGEMVFQVSVDAEVKLVRLRYVHKAPGSLPAGELRAFEQLAENAPLRLIYNPAAVDTDGVVDGVLYFRSGTSVSLEMVRRGIAEADPGGLPGYRKKVFKEAQEQARQLKKGVWLNDNGTGLPVPLQQQ